MKCQRDTSDETTTPDGAKQHIGAGTLGGKLIERLKAGTGLARDDLRVIKRVEQGKALFRSDLPCPLRRHFLASALAVIGQHDSSAITSRRITLCHRCIERHNDCNRNTKRLAGGGHSPCAKFPEE